MQLPALVKSTLVKRYKRFLADVTLEDGREITAHCPNSGAMVDIKEPGMTVYVSKSDNPKRKLAYTFEFVEDEGVIIGGNTGYPNRLVNEALGQKFFPFLEKEAAFRKEVYFDDKTRFDFLVEESGQKTWLEVKNVHLKRGAAALFPDSVTTRGKKHLETLIEAKKQGCRAVMVYVIQRDDVEAFGPAFDFDKAYAESFYEAKAAGVEIYAYTCKIDLTEINLHRALPILSREDALKMR